MKVKPHIIPHQEHLVTSKLISKNAKFVLDKLNQAGFEAYMVGGGVRDIMLNVIPKDFDIVTNAHPEEVRRVFNNCRLIGRRFRLAHIYFGQDIIEVATFRGKPEDSDDEENTHRHPETGMILRDNQYGTIDDDVWRRDFTINALYYNNRDHSIVDYTQGVDDLHTKTLRLIGNPSRRYTEDPVRMLRAIRLAVKLGLSIEQNTHDEIAAHASLLLNVSNARLFEEVLKLFLTGYATATYQALAQHGLLVFLIPMTMSCTSSSAIAEALVQAALRNTDLRLQENKPINPAFLLAIFLWHPYVQRLGELLDNAHPLHEARQMAFEKVHKKQIQHVAIPRRFVDMIHHMFDLQPKLEKRDKKHIQRTLEHKRFRAAYDLLVLRAQSGETEVQAAADWWTQFQAADSEGRKQLLQALKAPHKRRRKKRKPRTSS